MSKQADYCNYQEWKGWRSLFAPTAAESGLYGKQFQNVDFAGKQVLEIGFGSGSLMRWISDRGGRSCGVELQTKLVDAARDHGFTAWNSVDEIPDTRFDVVIAFDVFEHLLPDEITELFVTVAKCLRPGGLLVIRIPNCQSPFGLINQLGDTTHRTMLSGPLLAGFASSQPLKLLTIENAYDERTFGTPLRALMRRLTQWLTMRVVELSWGSRSTPSAAEVILRFERL